MLPPTLCKLVHVGEGDSMVYFCPGELQFRGRVYSWMSLECVKVQSVDFLVQLCTEQCGFTTLFDLNSPIAIMNHCSSLPCRSTRTCMVLRQSPRPSRNCLFCSCHWHMAPRRTPTMFSMFSPASVYHSISVVQTCSFMIQSAKCIQLYSILQHILAKGWLSWAQFEQLFKRSAEPNSTVQAMLPELGRNVIVQASLCPESSSAVPLEEK